MMAGSPRRNHIPKPPPATSAFVSRVMKSNRDRGTAPEQLLRIELQRLGLENFIMNVDFLTGKPDFVFPFERAAIFVHGCFWHRHGRCRIALPRTHRTYWRRKLDANRRRDRRVRDALRGQGWHVLTVWECNLKADAEAAAIAIDRQISRIG